MRKKPECIIMESWEGSRLGNDFLESLSDDAYIGFVTAMTMVHNPNIGISPIEIYNIAYKILIKN